MTELGKLFQTFTMRAEKKQEYVIHCLVLGIVN